MPHPWLRIPLADYEGHMSATQVAQLRPLAELFGRVLQQWTPESVAILGIAGGNGLEHLDRRVTRRVVGLDIHPEYLAEVQRRYANRVNGLELYCADLSLSPIALPPVALVHAALVFEHAGLGWCLDNAVALVAPGGVLSVVLQLPSAESRAVAPTGFDSLQQLAPHFSFVDPILLERKVTAMGFSMEAADTHPLPGGKGLWHVQFRRLS